MSKTAMKEMLLNIEALESITTDQEQIYMLAHLKVGALVLFKKEKEHIITAYENGYDSHNDFIYSNGEKYYNKTFEK
jgi:hypothetical protein